MECLPANVLWTEMKLVALNGIGAKANCYRIDSTSAFKDLEFPTPAWRDLKNANSAEAIQNLQALDQASSTFQGKTGYDYTTISPSYNSGNKITKPHCFIPVLSTKFREFDRVSTTVKACTILRPV